MRLADVRAGVAASARSGGQEDRRHPVFTLGEDRRHPVFALVDWTGRQLRATAAGMIPAELAPILDRLGVESDRWLDTIRHFGRWFKRAAGRRDSLTAMAAQSGRSWFQGQRAAAIAFRS